MRRSIAQLLVIALFGSCLYAQSIIIYTEISPPYQFLGPDGQLTGCSYDVLREIQRRVGNKDPIELVPWIRGYKELQERPNVVLFSMARSKERDSLFEWVGPIQETVYSFYARADSGIVIKSLEDAKKLKLIGVYREDARDLYLSKQGFTNLDRSIDNQTALRKLMDGRINCMVSTSDSIGEIAKDTGFRPEDVKVVFPFLKVQLYIAFSKAIPASTLVAWTRAFQAMKQDGTFERIYRKYIPHSDLPGPALKPY